MVYKSCCFYPTEYKKVYQFLDNMKQEGYIVKSIDFKKEKAEFIKVLVNMSMELIIQYYIHVIDVFLMKIMNVLI